jgi:hypothetical protein
MGLGVLEVPVGGWFCYWIVLFIFWVLLFSIWNGERRAEREQGGLEGLTGVDVDKVPTRFDVYINGNRNDFFATRGADIAIVTGFGMDLLEKKKTIPPPPGGTAILPEYIHYYGYYYQVIVQCLST